uniref:Immunoglobulin V-set domain-containing protein n=1 Tax=Podarcis muralis TaxID=64176 RepID=A0A670IKA1_PODMU
ISSSLLDIPLLSGHGFFQSGQLAPGNHCLYATLAQQRQGQSSTSKKDDFPLCFLFPALGGEASLLVSQPNVNTTVAQNVLLSVAHTFGGSPVIKWTHTSPRGTSKIAEWKPRSYANISSGYVDRVKIYDNGSLQLLNVDIRDTGYYLVTRLSMKTCIS